MKLRRTVSKARQNLNELAKMDLRGLEALGENIEDAVQEALEILESGADQEDGYALEDFNAAFEEVLKS